MTKFALYVLQTMRPQPRHHGGFTVRGLPARERETAVHRRHRRLGGEDLAEQPDGGRGHLTRAEAGENMTRASYHRRTNDHVSIRRKLRFIHDRSDPACPGSRWSSNEFLRGVAIYTPIRDALIFVK